MMYTITLATTTTTITTAGVMVWWCCGVVVEALRRLMEANLGMLEAFAPSHWPPIACNIVLASHPTGLHQRKATCPLVQERGR